MRHPLYLIEQGSKLSVSGRRLVVGKDGETLHTAAVMQIDQVICFGNVQVTTPAIRLLADEGVDLVFLSERGRFYSRLSGVPNGNVALRVAQVLTAHDAATALAIARAVVAGKVHNMRTFLQRYARRRTTAEPALDAAIAELGELLGRLPRAQTVNSLLGHEGRAAAAYYSVWPHLLKTPWTFEKRVRRPPTDPVNAVIGFLYTLLTQNVQSAVLTAGFDPGVGFLHQIDYNRPSLALDLVEEFRSIVADSVALRCFNNAILTAEHFQVGDDPARPLVITPDGVRLIVREFETRVTQTFKHPVNGEQTTWRRLFLLQAHALSRALLARETSPPTYAPFLVR